MKTILFFLPLVDVIAIKLFCTLIKVNSMMSINRKNMLILSFVFAVMIFDINVIHCCSKSEPITTTKPPDTTTSKMPKSNTMDQDR